MTYDLPMSLDSNPFIDIEFSIFEIKFLTSSDSKWIIRNDDITNFQIE